MRQLKLHEALGDDYVTVDGIELLADVTVKYQRRDMESPFWLVDWTHGPVGVLVPSVCAHTGWKGFETLLLDDGAFEANKALYAKFEAAVLDAAAKRIREKIDTEAPWLWAEMSES